ncbi:MAG: hypothetical protein AAB508_05160 [Patescibacteria group bacterium]
MFTILPLSPRQIIILSKHGLLKKWEKQIAFLRTNPRHPSLNTEILEPKEHGIYSFRIDLKFRAIFFFHEDHKTIEILTITNHYH